MASFSSEFFSCLIAVRHAQIVLAGAGNDIFGFVYATGVEFSFTLWAHAFGQTHFIGPADGLDCCQLETADPSREREDR